MRSAAVRLQTLLTVLPRFAATPRQSLEQLAQEFEMSPLELAADLAALAERADESSAYEYGAVVQIEGDTVEVTADHFGRPMRLTMAELCALELGLNILGHECSPEMAARIGTLLEKLRTVIVDLPRDDAQRSLRGGALAGATGGEVLSVLREALRGAERVELHYQSARSADTTPRVVHPYGLAFAFGNWYLAAWCEQSDERRIFRTDRISQAASTGEHFTHPVDFRIEDVLVNGRPWNSSGPTPELVVRYSPEIARWIVDRDGGPLEPDGSAIRTMPLADREWAIRHVLEHAPEATVLEPAEIRAEIVERLRGMAPADD